MLNCYITNRLEPQAIADYEKVHVYSFYPPLVGGWTNPFEKYARQIGIISLNFRGENAKNIWVATTVSSCRNMACFLFNPRFLFTPLCCTSSSNIHTFRLQLKTGPSHFWSETPANLRTKIGRFSHQNPRSSYGIQPDGMSESKPIRSKVYHATMLQLGISWMKLSGQENHRLPIFTGKGGHFSLQKPTVCLVGHKYFKPKLCMAYIWRLTYLGMILAATIVKNFSLWGSFSSSILKLRGGVVLVPHLLGNCGFAWELAKPPWSNLTHIFEMGWLKPPARW